MDAIGTLESERQNLEMELEKTKRTAEGLTQSQAHSSPANSCGVERIKERYAAILKCRRISYQFNGYDYAASAQSSIV